MTTRRRKSFLRRPAVLVVAFVSIIALTGVVYAHWFAETTVQGNVQAGNLGVQWWAGGTDDDGILGNDWSGDDCDDAFSIPNAPDSDLPCPLEDWDGNPPHDNGTPGDPDDDYQGSSADPSEHGPGPVARYDKDVATCDAHGEGWTLQVDVWNAYPSYWCTAYGQLYGDQNIPVKAAGAFVYESGEFFENTFGGWFEDPEFTNPWDGDVSFDGEGNPCADGIEDDPTTTETNEYVPGDGSCEGDPPVYGQHFETPLDVTEPEDGKFVATAPDGRHVLTVWIAGACGWQIDPFFDWETGRPFEGPEPNWGAVSVHLEQDAQQGVNYSFAVHPRFVNWNEFPDDESLCTFDLLPPPPPE